MSWLPIKDTPIIKMLQKLAELQTSVTELLAKEKLNDARARILSVQGLHHTRAARRAALEKKEQDGKN